MTKQRLDVTDDGLDGTRISAPREQQVRLNPYKLLSVSRLDLVLTIREEIIGLDGLVDRSPKHRTGCVRARGVRPEIELVIRYVPIF